MAAIVQTSSFQKRTKLSTSNVIGTKISPINSLLYVSSGVPSLDSISEEDMYGSYAKMIIKYFLAEGINHNNYIFAASLNENPWDVLNSLPSPIVEPKNDVLPTKEELKIAWRYENLSMEDEKTGNSFDLSMPYSIPESKRANIVAWPGEKASNAHRPPGTLRNGSCISLLQTVDECIKKWELEQGSNSNQLLRIVISSFGSPFWAFNEKEYADFTATLLLLKSLVRSAKAVALVTIPHQLINPVLISRSRGIADVAIQLKSLREDKHLQDLMDVHGILEMKKITNLTSPKVILGQDGTTSYGFKATKRKFKIEKLHIPPSLEDEKSAPSAEQSPFGCASKLSKTNLDF